MTNYYDLAASEDWLPCDQEQLDQLKALLVIPEPGDDATIEEMDQHHEQEHGFEVKLVHDTGRTGLLLYHDSDENGSCYPSRLPQPFLNAIAELLQAHELDTLEVGVAQLASRTEIAAYSGYRFRITSAGFLEAELPGQWAPWVKDETSA